MKKIALIFFLLSGLVVYSQNQDSTFFQPQFTYGARYEVQTASGLIYRGRVIDESRDFVLIEDKENHVRTELRKSEIISKKFINLKKGYDTDLLGENYHARNYLFSSSAFLFEEGQATSNSHWFLLENIDYALTDNWAVSINSVAFYPVSVGLKCAYKIGEYGYLGAGAFGIGNTFGGGGQNNLWGYSALGRITQGTGNKNFTISAGLLGLNSDFFWGSRSVPFVNMAFMSAAYCNRINKRFAFNAEGWYLPQMQVGIGGIGFKFVEDQKTCWSFGCFSFLSTKDNTVKFNFKTIPLPYFGLERKFN